MQQIIIYSFISGFIAKLMYLPLKATGLKHTSMYEGNSISKLQIQVATYVFELSAGNCHR